MKCLAHSTMPTPMPPRVSASRTPSAWGWPPCQYTTARAMAASMATTNDAADASSTRIPRRVSTDSPSTGRGASLMAGPRDSGVAAERAAGADPGHEHQHRGHADQPRHEPLGDRAGAPDRDATGVGRVLQVLDVAAQVVQVPVVDDLGPEHRHLARTDADRRPPLGGRRLGQPGGRPAVA